MKILMLAPHPFYQERGTPIAVKLLLQALSERGYEVDLLTFNEGELVDFPGLRIYRVRPFPAITDVRPGFSIKKIMLDVLLFGKFIALMLRNKYQVVHAIEESAFMAMVVCPLFRMPYIYDMDSSMATQVLDKMPALKGAEPVFRWLESLPMKKADLVVPVCDALAREVTRYRNDGICVLKDVSLVSVDGEKGSAQDIRQCYKVSGAMLMYIGNLEPYQGIDLMIEAFAIHAAANAESTLVVIGGEENHIQAYKDKCRDLGVEDRVVFMGKQPVSMIGDLMSQADVLVSPRIHGVNTPMKIYSYLGSGVPMLATDLPTHTQVVDSTTAYLASPEKQVFARGMDALCNDAGLRKKLATNAMRLIEQEHSYPVFRERLYAIYENLMSP